MTSAVRAAVLAALLAISADARAQQGTLTQLPGPEGCISDDGSGPCTDGDLLYGAFAVTLSPDGRHAYVGLIDSRAIAVLARDKKTGALSQLSAPHGCHSGKPTGALCTDAVGLLPPFQVAASPDGKHVYVASYQQDPVSLSALVAFERDAETGALTQLPGGDGCISEDLDDCAPGIGLRGMTSVAVSRDGAHVYVASEPGAVAVFARDAKTGALTQLPEPQGCVSWDGSGGRCTEGKALRGARGLALSPDGAHVYVASVSSQAVAAFARDKKTGALTQLPDLDGCIADDDSSVACTPGVGLGGPNAVAVSPNGRHVYVTSYVSDEVAVLQRNKKTGVLTQLPPPDGCVSGDGSGGLCADGVALGQAFFVAVSPNGKHVYVAARDDYAVAVFAQSKKTGVLTQLPTPTGCIADEGTGDPCRDARALGLPRAVTVSKDGKHVYVASQASAAVAVLQRAK